jgi:N-acetylglutamate synthase-like GNAT family acetyltransferase
MTRLGPLFALQLAAFERDGLKAALAGAGLVTEDIDDPALVFWRFEIGDMPVGFGGLEMHGDVALLRSVVTLPPLRRRGIGRAMVAVLETEATARTARAIYLLTTDAAPVFTRLGYAACARADVPAAIRASAQFAALCAPTAIVMTKEL